MKIYNKYCELFPKNLVIYAVNKYFTEKSKKARTKNIKIQKNSRRSLEYWDHRSFMTLEFFGYSG